MKEAKKSPIKKAGWWTPGYEGLGCAIVEQAVHDWRYLISKNQRKRRVYGRLLSFTELRKFFKSRYCDLLLLKSDPKKILAKLESELQEAIENGDFRETL